MSGDGVVPAAGLVLVIGSLIGCSALVPPAGSNGARAVTQGRSTRLDRSSDHQRRDGSADPRSEYGDRVRVGLSIPVMAEPSALVAIGETAEGNGWDGVFLWHHVVGTPDFPALMADAWVVLGALAVRTARVTLGTTITALPRHQPQEVARQAVTVDRLSGGRMVLGVGLGEPPSEYTALGRTADRSVLAAMLDVGLEVLRVSGRVSRTPTTARTTPSRTCSSFRGRCSSRGSPYGRLR
jgi:hypothetical protein